MADNRIITIAELNINVDSAINSSAKLAESLAALKKERKELKIEDADYYNQLVKKNSEIIIADKLYKNSIAIVNSLTAATKDQVGTIQQLEIQNRALAAEQRGVNILSAEGLKRSNELNAQIDKNTEVIKENSSATKKQAMNIGNYEESVLKALETIKAENAAIQAGSKIQEIASASKIGFVKSEQKNLESKASAVINEQKNEQISNNQLSQSIEIISTNVSEESAEVRKLIGFKQELNRTINETVVAQGAESASVAKLTTLLEFNEKQLLETKQAELALMELNEKRALEASQAAAKTADVVANAKPKFDSLGNSMAQLSRESSAFVNSAQTGFMAISNNIPAFSDAISQMKKEGASTKDVFKAIGGSLLSFNFLLGIGIAALTLYGPAISKWIGSLFSAEKQLNATTKAQMLLTEARATGAKEAQKELTSLKILYDATQDQTKSLKDRNLAVDELQKKYPAYFENMSNESILAGNAAGKYKELTQSIIEKAKAKAIESKITENAVKQLEIEQKIIDIQKQREINDAKTRSTTSGTQIGDAANENANIMLANQVAIFEKKSAKEIGILKKQAAEIEKINKKLQEGIKVPDIIDPKKPDVSKTGGSVSVKRDNTDWYVKQLNEVNESLLPESLEKRNKIIIDKYKLLRTEIEQKVKEDADNKTLTDLGRKSANEAIEKSFDAQKLEIKKASAKELTEFLDTEAKLMLTKAKEATDKDIEITQQQHEAKQNLYREARRLLEESEFEKLNAGIISQKEYNEKILQIEQELKNNLTKLDIDTETQNEDHRKQRSEINRANNAIANQDDFIAQMEERKNQLAIEYSLEIEASKKNHADVNLIEKKYAVLTSNIDKEVLTKKLSVYRGMSEGLKEIFSENAALAKGFAVVTATIDTISSAQSAFTVGTSIGGPPLGLAYAAIATGVGLANIAKILSTNTDVSASSTGGVSSSTQSTTPTANINTQAQVGQGIVERTLPNYESNEAKINNVLVLQDVEYKQAQAKKTALVSVD